ncbi:MAG: Fe-S cluster assembly protein SufB [Patescibacteria group bacterium]
MDALREVLETPSTHVPKYAAPIGLSREGIFRIASEKNEPQWVTDKRLLAFEHLLSSDRPSFGPSLDALDLSKITFFVQPNSAEHRTWDDVPEEIRGTFEKLGIPKAERNGLAGVGAQYDSEMVYHNLQKDLADQGVFFLNMDVAVREHEELVREHFMTNCVPIHDHYFAMLHAAVWSGGTFIYVPKGAKVTIPLQAYFRMNAERGGQFEHTLIIADEGSEVHYIEGCSAPKYDSSALHAGCVEIHVKKNATVRYTSIENWSKNTFNLNTKRALVDEDGTIVWLNGNMGSGVTMLYPMSVLRGAGSKSDYLGIAFAGPGQEQDTGHKVALVAPNTSANVRSKSIAVGGGTSTYRGLVKSTRSAVNSAVSVVCDTLMLDEFSRAITIPIIEDGAPDMTVTHEATVGRLDDAQMNYLATRGLTVDEARRTIVGGFLDPIVRELPLEYAVEFLELVSLEMDGAVA